MSVELKMDVKGEQELRRALAAYGKVCRKDAFNALRYGAYYVGRSLAARTKKSKTGPKILSTDESVAALLAVTLPKPAKWTGTEAGWKYFLLRVGDKAFYAKSDRPNDLNGIRARNIWMKDRYNQKEVARFTRFRRSGLAKKSWSWLGGKARSKNGNGPKIAEDSENSVSKSIRKSQSGVHVDEASLSIRISNRLNYITEALTTQNALAESIKAATNQIIHQTKEAMKKSVDKMFGTHFSASRRAA